MHFRSFRYGCARSSWLGFTLAVVAALAIPRGPALALCDCANPPCSGTSLAQASPAPNPAYAQVPPSVFWCPTCDAAAVSTLSMAFTCAGGPCVCGRYVTGDYWIVDPAPANPAVGVVISSVSPAAANGRHGMEIDPEDDAGPFDARANPWQYSAAENVSLPFVANAPQSLVKAISLEPSHKTCEFGFSCGSNGVCVHSYFVVTIVGAAPPADAYRPPYFSSVKPTTTWRDSQIDWSLVPSFDVASLPGAPTLAQAYGYVRAPQIDHWPAPGGYNQQQLALVGTGAGGGTYGADMAGVRSDALCRALGPEPVASGNPSRRDILRAFVQQGLDTYWIMRTVGLDSPPILRWMVSGGHGPGRKAGLVLAATLLGDDEMRTLIRDSVEDEIATGDHFFSEDGLVYHSTRAGRALFGEVCPPHGTGDASSNALGWWKPGGVGGICRDPEGLIDGGNHAEGGVPGYEYGWSSAAVSAGVFGALMPQFKSVWAHDPFFGLADRWFGYETIPGDTGAPGGLWMDDACQDTMPASFAPYSGCLAGTGRRCGTTPCESFHGVGGRGEYSYVSRFCERVWESFRGCAANPAAPGCAGFVGLFCGDGVCAGAENASSCGVDCP